MGKIRNVLVSFSVIGMLIFAYAACDPTTPPTEPAPETTVNDGGTTDSTVVTEKPMVKEDAGGTDTAPPKEEVVEAVATGPITMEFSPAAGGQIDVSGDDSCIQVTFSHKPCSKGWKIELKREGATVAVPVLFEFDPKERTKAKICPLGLLRMDVKYNLSVTVSENVKSCDVDGKKHTGNSNYTTKAPYKNDKPAEAGVSVNLKLKDITKPAGLSSLLSGLGDGDIPPILLHLHSRDEASKTLTFVGGLGKAPPGGKPHQGKDVIDAEKTPVSLALIGKYEGRAFYVGPTTFVLVVAGYSLRIDNFSLTGAFTADGKNVEFAKLTGVLDPALIEQAVGVNICTLLVGECFKDDQGKERILIAGSLEGIENPFPFSAFITTPVYLSTGFGTTAKAIFYTTGEVKSEDLTFTLSSCTGSSDEQKPCDTGKGATVTPITGTGKITVDANKKQGEYEFSEELKATTWYKLELEAKDANGATFKTFTIFQTQ